jgi:hypothetical protein
MMMRIVIVVFVAVVVAAKESFFQIRTRFVRMRRRAQTAVLVKLFVVVRMAAVHFIYRRSFVRRGCFFGTGTSSFYSGPKARIVFAPPFLICEAREELLEYDQRHVHRLAVSSVNNNERTPTELDSIKQSL